MGQICHHFSWTVDYLLWEVDWRIVQRMLIDMPVYETDKEKIEEIKFEEQSAEDLLKLFNQYKD